LWLDIKCDGITGGVLAESNDMELPSIKKHYEDTNFSKKYLMKNGGTNGI
jgi:hypothetical protein